jgi:WhiB family transcriptional regulator, redox-sensing transcriptional regulator
MIEPKFRTDPRDSEWIERARCIGEDPELFFPVGSGAPAIEQAVRAKAVCRQCPVIEACLTWALDTCQDAGVWGGLDEEERRVIRRARRRAAAIAAASTDRDADRGELVGAVG